MDFYKCSFRLKLGFIFVKSPFKLFVKFWQTRGLNSTKWSFFSVAVEFWDERYSSDIIFKEMRRSDLSTTKIKKKLDQQSAAYILQGYLDKYRNTV